MENFNIFRVFVYNNIGITYLRSYFSIDCNINEIATPRLPIPV